MATSTPNIKRVSIDYFVIRLPPGSGDGEDEMLVHREQVQSFFQYDRALRRNGSNIPELPAGYHQFRQAYEREARTRSRFAYVEFAQGRRPRVVLPGPSPTREEVLGPDADLRSQEEIEGGQVLNGAEAETLKSMLWEAADRVKRQREHSSRGYWQRRDRRHDDRRQKGPLAKRLSDSPFDRHRSDRRAPSKLERRSEKSKEVDNPSEYSADFSAEANSFFDQVDPPASAFPDQPVAGPSSLTLEQLAAAEAYAAEIGGEGVEVYEAGMDGIDDQAADPGTAAEDAE